MLPPSDQSIRSVRRPYPSNEPSTRNPSPTWEKMAPIQPFPPPFFRVPIIFLHLSKPLQRDSLIFFSIFLSFPLSTSKRHLSIWCMRQNLVLVGRNLKFFPPNPPGNLTNLHVVIRLPSEWIARELLLRDYQSGALRLMENDDGTRFGLLRNINVRVGLILSSPSPLLFLNFCFYPLPKFLPTNSILPKRVKSVDLSHLSYVSLLISLLPSMIAPALSIPFPTTLLSLPPLP